MAQVPQLIYFIFGDEAERVQATAGERLLRWAKAFDEWLAVHQNTHADPLALKLALKSWRELFQHVQALPWEMRREDMEGYCRALEEAGASKVTIKRRMTDIGGFYKYCHKNKIDQAWAEPLKGTEVFNPAKKAALILRNDDEKGGYLEAEEAQAFLEAIEKDGSLVGKRDYAFFLAQLTTGVSAMEYCRARWGDLEIQGEQAFLHIQPIRKKRNGENKATRRVALPAETWEAIQDYLKAAGRLDTMEPQKILFAPLKNPLAKSPSGRACEWNEEKPPSVESIKMMMKRYCRAAGLDTSKVSYNTLRHTAIMLRLEAGDGAKEIQEFLGNERLDSTTRYIKKLMASPHERMWSKKPRKPIRRGPNRLKKGNEIALKHGFFQKSRGKQEATTVSEGGATAWEGETGHREAVLQTMDGQIDNMEKEIVKYRAILDKVYELMANADSTEEAVRLLDVYGLAINRLSTALRVQTSLPNSKTTWETYLERSIRYYRENRYKKGEAE